MNAVGDHGLSLRIGWVVFTPWRNASSLGFLMAQAPCALELALEQGFCNKGNCCSAAKELHQKQLVRCVGGDEWRSGSVPRRLEWTSEQMGRVR